MANIKLYFKTRHRNREKIDKDAHILYEVLSRHSQKVLYTAYSNSLIIFNVYKVDVKQRMNILSDVSNKILLGYELQTLDLIDYSII